MSPWKGFAKIAHSLWIHFLPDTLLWLLTAQCQQPSICDRSFAQVEHLQHSEVFREEPQTCISKLQRRKEVSNKLQYMVEQRVMGISDRRAAEVSAWLLEELQIGQTSLVPGTNCHFHHYWSDTMNKWWWTNAGRVGFPAAFYHVLLNFCHGAPHV